MIKVDRKSPTVPGICSRPAYRSSSYAPGMDMRDVIEDLEEKIERAGADILMLTEVLGTKILNLENDIDILLTIITANKNNHAILKTLLLSEDLRPELKDAIMSALHKKESSE